MVRPFLYGSGLELPKKTKCEFSCQQWLVMDSQQLHYPYFIITKKHYTCKQDVDLSWSPENTEYCFHPIKPIKESRLTGEFARRIYEGERK